MLYVLLAQLGPLGGMDRVELLVRHRIEHLPAETRGGDAGADALARGVDGRRGARGAAADDEDVERLLRGALLGRLRLGAGVELREDLFEFHPALAEILAIQEDRRPRHYLPRLDLRLTQTADDRGVGVARVGGAHPI